MFGVSPERFERERAAAADAQALAFARLSPIEKASFGVQRGAYGLAGALGGALGGQDPELQRVTKRQQVAGQIDYTNEDSIRQGMARLSDDPAAVQQLAQILRQQQESGALVGQRSAAQTASLAQASKVQLSIDQETKLRDELSKLPAGATEDDIRAVVVKYGDPDKVLTALTTAATREADREARIDAAKVLADARVEAAREAGANRLQIAQIQADNKREMAQLVAALKGPSPAVLRAQEKAEKVAEGKETLGDILSTAQTLVTDLKTSGGMSSTSAGALSNLITSTQTGTAGQFLGSVFGTEAQSKRDQLKSVRLQLLNAIKEATGMSAQQLNSNVELQTYLKSLGSEGMTAEANLAIIDNLSKTYLGKGMMGAPTAVQPIYAQNPKTGERIMSTDGGKTWNLVR
jgi:hypothetical protein